MITTVLMQISTVSTQWQDFGVTVLYIRFKVTLCRSTPSSSRIEGPLLYNRVPKFGGSSGNKCPPQRQSKLGMKIARFSLLSSETSWDPVGPGFHFSTPYSECQKESPLSPTLRRDKHTLRTHLTPSCQPRWRSRRRVREPHRRLHL